MGSSRAILAGLMTPRSIQAVPPQRITGVAQAHLKGPQQLCLSGTCNISHWAKHPCWPTQDGWLVQHPVVLVSSGWLLLNSMGLYV
jgi:hypothetical protein